MFYNLPPASLCQEEGWISYQNAQALLGEDDASHFAAPEALLVEEAALDEVVAVVALNPGVAGEAVVHERRQATPQRVALSVRVKVGSLERLRGRGVGGDEEECE